MTKPLDAELADICRNPENPKWKAAWDKIQEIFGNAARQHPLTKKLRGRARDDRVRELAHEFWIHLLKNRAALQARSTLGAGALWIESWRFLDRQRAQDEPDLLRVLKKQLHSKIRSILRDDSRVVARGRFWQISPESSSSAATNGSATNRGSSRLAPALLERELVRRLRPLESQLKPQRPGQLPPIVMKEKLRDFLLLSLQLANRPVVDWELTDIVWASLEPHPQNVFAISAKTLGEEHLQEASGRSSSAVQEERLVRLEWACRIDIVASRFVAGLSRRAGKVAVLKHRNHTIREIGKILAVSSGTAGNEVKKFELAFGELVESEGLSESEARELILLILDTLEVEAFSDE